MSLEENVFEITPVTMQEENESRSRLKSQYNDLVSQAKALEKSQPEEWYRQALIQYSDAHFLKKKLAPLDDNGQFSESDQSKLTKLRKKITSLQRKCISFGSDYIVEARGVNGDHGGFLFDYLGDDYVLNAYQGGNKADKKDHKDDGSSFLIKSSTFDKLYLYQKHCLAWLWSLHSQNAGGILGDDMGLGKTVQISAFLSALFHSGHVERILILCPVSVLTHWMAELQKWCPDVPSCLFHGGKKASREALEQVLTEGGILVTSYGRCKSQLSALTSRIRMSSAAVRHTRNSAQDDEDDEMLIRQDEFFWDYAILDEGHCIKNPDIQLSHSVRQLPTRHRLILSGTPIQNNLQEIWALYDFVSRGQLLGDRKTFKNEFALKIKTGSAKDATDRQKQVAKQMASSLRRLIRPFFLRREKKTLKLEQAQQASLNQPSTTTTTRNKHELFSATKRDVIVWSYLSTSQQNLYRAFLDSDEVKLALNATASPLAALTVLKKICDHPRLLSEQMKTCKSLQLLNSSFAYDAASLLAESKKLDLLITLLQSHQQDGHRTLIFSQSKKMLDLMEIVLQSFAMRMLRIDGDVTKPEERQRLVNEFNSNEDIFCFLLTTRTGGLGINLTGANRVIIFDPAWNPAVDNQAVDRSYRIGQTRDVIVYRFITCGTIEEVIYRKQVFKGSLLKMTTQSDDDENEMEGEWDVGTTENIAKNNSDDEEGNEQQRAFILPAFMSAKKQRKKALSTMKSSLSALPRHSPRRYFKKSELRDVFSLRDTSISVTQQQLCKLHPEDLKLSTNQSELSEVQKDVHFLQSQAELVYGIHFHDLLFTSSGLKAASSLGVSSDVKEEVYQGERRLIQSRTPMVKGKVPPTNAVVAASADESTQRQLFADTVDPESDGETYLRWDAVPVAVEIEDEKNVLGNPPPLEAVTPRPDDVRSMAVFGEADAEETVLALKDLSLNTHDIIDLVDARPYGEESSFNVSKTGDHFVDFVCD